LFVKTGLFTTLVALAVACVLAAPAAAATPTQRKLASQIKVMQRQVKVLQGQVKKLRADMREVQGISASALVFSACSTAATADAFQGTWETIDAINAHFTPPRPDQYPAPTPIADPLNSCQLLEVQRQPGAVPPTTNVFAALLNIFR
jgi:type II secretory pathway pseudopilin PulG